jgi:hypothetical protein
MDGEETISVTESNFNLFFLPQIVSIEMVEFVAEVFLTKMYF